jgi:hypothetical protein
MGRTAETTQLMQDLNECGQKRYVRDHVYALMYIALGQKETAIDYLEKSSDSWLGINPLLDPLRNEPRFQRLVEKTFSQVNSK